MGFRLARLAARAAASRRGPHAAVCRALAPASPAEPSRGPHWLVPARGHVGHSHHHGEEGGEASERIFRLGLAADVVLTVGKTVTGYLSGSTAIAADAAHSLSDIVLSGVALLSYKAAKAPRDKEHPYGHGKFESLGALGISSMLLVTSGGIAWHAFEVLQPWQWWASSWNRFGASSPCIERDNISNICQRRALLDHKKSWGKGREWADES